MATRHLVIHGLVQGVGYRASLAWKAGTLGIAGWVRNRRDGTVEAMVCGTDEDVAGIIAWARKGPSGASVSKVEVSEGSGQFHGFEQLPSV
jgi:acylphosphatase